MTYEYQTLKVAIGPDGVTILTLNRPEQLNAFTVQMGAELQDFFTRINRDDSVSAVVLTGAGRAFCAGMDLSTPGNVFGLNESLQPTLQDLEQRGDDPEILNGVRDSGGRVVLTMLDCLKPIICAVNGVAVGIGATLTLATDIRLAAEYARFGFVFTKLGIVPEACSTWYLPRIVGIQTAFSWMYRADMVDAGDAKTKGLVSEVMPLKQLLDEATALARHIVKQHSPVSLALTRQMLYRNSVEPHPRHAHNVESLGMFYTSQQDGKEGVAAFHEKRPPVYTSKVSQMPSFFPWWTK